MFTSLVWNESVRPFQFQTTGLFISSARVSASLSTRQTSTALPHDGPNHLGLWFNYASLPQVRATNHLAAACGARRAVRRHALAGAGGALAGCLTAALQLPVGLTGCLTAVLQVPCSCLTALTALTQPVSSVAIIQLSYSPFSPHSPHTAGELYDCLTAVLQLSYSCLTAAPKPSHSQ